MSIVSQNVEAFSLDNTSVSTSGYTYSSWLSAKADDIAVLYRVATLNATSLSLTIQGRSPNTYIHPASIYTVEILAVQTVHEIKAISEKFGEIRIGAKIDTAATPNILYAGLLRSETK